jgi:hypothetical protein
MRLFKQLNRQANGLTGRESNGQTSKLVDEQCTEHSIYV